MPEVESKTQPSRPRPTTQKKFEAKAEDQFFEDRPSRGRDRNGEAKDRGHKFSKLR